MGIVRKTISILVCLCIWLHSYSQTASRVYISSITPITGTASTCQGATTSLANATSGGTWSSGNTAVATVSSSGVVTGVSAGTATISYMAGGTSVTATVTINPLPSAGSIAGSGSI